MASIKFYLSRFIKKDDERGEIQLRFSGNRNFVKRAATGIFITAGNWDAEKGMPKGKKQKYDDNCEEIRDRLSQLTNYLLRCWERLGEGELEPDSLTKWMNDIEWIEKEVETYIGGSRATMKNWILDSKKRIAESEEAKKRELAKLEKRYFLDVFGLILQHSVLIGICTHIIEL